MKLKGARDRIIQAIVQDKIDQIEGLLNDMGISIRDENGDYSFADVMERLGDKWEEIPR